MSTTAASAPNSGSSIDQIRDAFTRLESEIHGSDARMFKSTSLDAVREAARIIERDQGQRRTLRNLRKIEPLCQALGRFGGAIETLCQGTPYLCFIWAPIKLMLQIADDYTQGFKILVDAYGQIAQHLPRLDRFASVFADQPDFQAVLADVYTDLVDFHLHAYKLLRRPGWKLLFDASWRGFQARFNAILRGLSENKRLIDDEANSFNILEAKAFRTRLYASLEREESDRRIWQLRDTVAWLDLKGLDREQEDLFERRSQARNPDTCHWILNNSAIATWLDEEDQRPFVWLHGKPGSGKTTLATYLAEHCALSPSSDLLYCLCSYGFGKAEQNPCGLLLRSLIAQLLRRHTDLLPYVYDNYVKLGAVPSLKNIKELLFLLLDSLGTIFLILDGLDECEAIHQKQMLAELTALRQIPGNRPSGAARLKVLICSRETKDIQRKLIKVPTVSLSKQQFVDRDIAIFVRNSLQELVERFEEAIVHELERDLVSKADGMFLWAQLVVETVLAQESIRDLRAAIQSLPSGLPGVYRYILDRIRLCEDDRQSARARHILGWLAFSYRPLRSWELCDGLVFGEPLGLLNEESKLGPGILDICKPLIEERDANTYALVHFSAREFLLHNASTDAGPYLTPSIVHSDLSIMCLRYLSSCEIFLDSQPARDINADVIRGFHQLFPYVYQFWTSHISECQKFITTCKPTAQGEISNLLDRIFLTYNHVKTTDACYLPDAVSTQDTARCCLTGDTWQRFQQYHGRESTWIVPQSRQDPETDVAVSERDPTRLSEAYQNFQTIFERCLDDTLPLSPKDAGVTSEELRRFRLRHSTAAYLCRFKGCIWASFGFANAEDRRKHECMHTQDYVCPEPDCGLKLGSRRALKLHNRRYHTQVADLTLPTFTPRARRERGPLDKPNNTQATQMGQMGIPSAHPQPRLLNATISGAEEKYTIKCICGYADDRPNTVYCERCDTWQHIECYYPSQQVPDEHFCADCLPQDIDARGAADRQRLRLKRLKRAALGGDHLGFADTHTPFLELETSKLLVAHRPKYTEILEQLDTKPSSLEFQDIIERVKVLHESADTRVESCERALRLIHEQMRDHATEQEERDRRVEERRRNRGGQRKKVESLKSVKARERRPQFTNAMPPELSPTVPAWGPFS